MRFGSFSGFWIGRLAVAAFLLPPAYGLSAGSVMAQSAAQPTQQTQAPATPAAPAPASPAAQPQQQPATQNPQPPQASKPAAAQQPLPGTVKSTHGAWSIVCDKPNSSSNDQCGLIQDVVAEDRPEISLSVIVLNGPDHKSKILRVRAPLNILLPNGLGLNIDGKDIGRVNFTRCFSDGCYAEAILEDELVKTLRSGKTATFILFQTPEEGIGIPVELRGFAEGYDALQ